MPEPIVCLSDTLRQFLEALYVFLASLEKVILAFTTGHFLIQLASETIPG
jgi:hypothetical protein